MTIPTYFNRMGITVGGVEPVLLDYFYVEALEDGSTISCSNLQSSHNLSASLDQKTWTPLTTSTVATGVEAGKKIYLAGNTDNLGGWMCVKPTSDKKFKIGGKLMSLYSKSFTPPSAFNIVDVIAMYNSNTNLVECSVDFDGPPDAVYCFQNCTALTGLTEGFRFNDALAVNSMFNGCTSLKSIAAGFALPKCTENTQYMFGNCSSLVEIGSGFTAPSTKNVNYMFSGCVNLVDLPDGFEIPCAQYCASMFEECHSLTGVPESLVPSNVFNCEKMFFNCSSLIDIGSEFTCPNVLGGGYMFNGCTSLSSLPSKFTCPSLTNGTNMFRGCTALRELPDEFTVPSGCWGTSYMFYQCRSLTHLPSGFTKTTGTDKKYMFYQCYNLSGLPDGFNIETATDVQHMFYRCNSLTTFGDNVKIGGGATDNTDLTKTNITTIGDNFTWMPNVTYSGTWDPALGIKNVFPNATSVGSGWVVYNHHDGE